MKITFDFYNTDCQLYMTKEEWDKHPMSEVGWRRNRKVGTYQPQYRYEPEKFPCICFEGGFISRPDGPDEYSNLFLYDFEISEGDGNVEE